MSKIRTPEIRALLAESPSTAREISAALQMTPRDANVGLWVLQTHGHVCSLREVPRPVSDFSGRRTLKLYELTPRGRAHLRMKARERADVI